jgi:acyl-CoA synthetase (AMP-forming)/AMP-acid ligase II
MIEDWYESTNRTWGAVLAETAARYPDRELIVYRDQRVTYMDFYQRVQPFARGLLALGVGGYNAYPAEIENVLHTHTKIKMAQVFGVPDERLGEVGCTYIELQPGVESDEEEIVIFCRERMANYKAPRYVRFVGAADFPLTSSGKVKKFELRQQAIEVFSLAEDT